ncbi:MAG: VOC family protein [Acidimicrobiia bacterium]
MHKDDTPPGDDDTCATDIGLTHLAIPVADIEISAAFYARYASLRVVHQRTDGGTRVCWLADVVRPFVIVCLEVPESIGTPPDDNTHIGFGCRDRAEVDGIAERARAEGRSVDGPHDSGPPVGYWLMLRDPDGHAVEFSVGQAISDAVDGS